VPWATFKGCYDETREVAIISEGSRAESGALMGPWTGAEPRLCSIVYADFRECTF
jgi:hypothetical protein